MTHSYGEGLLRRVCVSASFAFCCFINTWVELAQGSGTYYARYHPLRVVVIPVLAWQALILSALLLGWEFLSRRPFRDFRYLHKLMLLACLWPLGSLAAILGRVVPFNIEPLVNSRWFWPMTLLCALPVAAGALWRPLAAFRFLRGAFLYAVPVFAFIALSTAWKMLVMWPPATYEDGTFAAPRPARDGVRMVWIVFDGFSREIAFTNRPAAVQLPNLDRLRAESFCALAASSPADFTRLSMPSLVLGRRITSARESGPADLSLTAESGGAPFAWSQAPNVFDDARALGAASALVGWYHPYGRVLAHSLTFCAWTPEWLFPGIEEPFQPEPLPAAMLRRLSLQVSALPLLGHFAPLSPSLPHREQKRKQFLYLMQNARRVAADPAFGLVLVHLPVPHPPGIYSRALGTYTSTAPSNYLDNLALADLALGEIRQAIEQATLWDRTALLVSADHGWRTHLWRGRPGWTAEEEAVAGPLNPLAVPFLVHLPGGRSTQDCSLPFNTVISRPLIMDILRGRITAPEQIPAWLASRALPR
ncbi:MAG TPA: alkaline phosphatase family protein [Bryobacteraceae bacterium]|nr:alkaline phosphatase family protein [Bryobacteraceae bacterium]